MYRVVCRCLSLPPLPPLPPSPPSPSSSSPPCHPRQRNRISLPLLISSTLLSRLNMGDHPPSYTPTLPQILVLPLPDATSWFQQACVQGEVFVKGLGSGAGAGAATGGDTVGVQSLQVSALSYSAEQQY